MSWQNDIETIVFTIITGDGKSWTPKWKNAVKDVEYNSSIFEFVNVEGSLVLREKPKGRKFDLEFYFDGEDAVLKGNDFEFSARDNRYWTVKHPFYGDFKCQPISLKQDNSALNVSKFNVPVVETITSPYPEAKKIIRDDISTKLTAVNSLQAQALSNSKELNKVELAQNVNYLKKVYSRSISVSDELKEFEGIVNNALNEITNVAATGQSILREIQRIINYPATIIQTLENRFNALKESFLGIMDSFKGSKNQFEAIGGSIIASMHVSSVKNSDEYKVRKYVVDQQIKLLKQYNQFIAFIDSQQTDRADSKNSYIPDYESMNALNELVSLTNSNLFEIAFLTKQEREYILDRDSNAILLTHKFYGLDGDDINLERFIETNNIGLNELINIKKGRKIVYYV